MGAACSKGARGGGDGGGETASAPTDAGFAAREVAALKAAIATNDQAPAPSAQAATSLEPAQPREVHGQLEAAGAKAAQEHEVAAATERVPQPALLEWADTGRTTGSSASSPRLHAWMRWDSPCEFKLGT
jgi:hypothetical protein